MFRSPYVLDNRFLSGDEAIHESSSGWMILISKALECEAIVVAEDHDITERLECQDESESDIYKVEKRR